jgi:hypothetical protein
MRALTLAATATVMIHIPAEALGTPRSATGTAKNGQACKLSGAGGFFGGQTGVVVDGKCVAVSSGASPSGFEYRTLSCLSDGTAVVHGSNVPATACDAGMPKCKLLVDGGQSGTNPVLAFEEQERAPGSTSWTTIDFWCPESTAPLPGGPDLAAIRDRVIRLLPHVPAVTTGPTTLVNIQTLLWADTPERRDLGQVTVVGQPVWLHLAFDHATWHFGDGTTTSVDAPGKAYDPTGDPCRRVTCPDYFGHTYTSTGVMTVSVRIAWHASYSLDGQHYQPVEATPLTGPTDTVRIHVRQARGVLVSTGD